MRHANLVGASQHGGVLVLAGDDPGCKSSTLPPRREGAMTDLGMPVLYPGDVQEISTSACMASPSRAIAAPGSGMKIVADVADAVGPSSSAPSGPNRSSRQSSSTASRGSTANPADRPADRRHR